MSAPWRRDPRPHTTTRLPRDRRCRTPPIGTRPVGAGRWTATSTPGPPHVPPTPRASRRTASIAAAHRTGIHRQERHACHQRNEQNPRDQGGCRAVCVQSQISGLPLRPTWRYENQAWSGVRTLEGVLSFVLCWDGCCAFGCLDLHWGMICGTLTAGVGHCREVAPWRVRVASSAPRHRCA